MRLESFASLVRSYTSKFEPWWTIIGAPLIQEVVFRFIPYQLFYLPTGKYWLVGIVTSIVYALIHWYFGIPVVIGAFILGLLLWWVMVKFGLLPAVFLHFLVNLVILAIWGERWLAK